MRDLQLSAPAQYPRRRAKDLRVTPQPLEPGWYALAIIGTALGVLGQAWYGYEGRVTGYPSAVEFYFSLCLVFVPSTLVILSRRATGFARIGFLLYMALALAATRYMLYPTMFVYHDPIVHEWNVVAIDETHHLFAPNAILPATPYYPGLEIATSAVQHLTGFPLHRAATLLLLLLRIVMTLGLVEVFQKITGNILISVTGALAYTVNPQYLFFNSQFSYQTVALPLCFFFIYVFSIRNRRLGVWGVVPAVAVAVAIAASHHLTSIALVVTLWVWYLYTRLRMRPEPNLAHVAILSTLAVAIWTWIASKELIPYMIGIVKKNIGGVSNLFGGIMGHKLFTDSAGDTAPEWEILLSLTSVLLICVVFLRLAWFVFKRRRSLGAPSSTLATAAALYPIIPAGHLAGAAGETASRASGFVFVGLGFIFASWWYSPRVVDQCQAARERLSDVTRRYRPNVRFRVPRLTWILALALTVCYAGGIVDGSGPNWQYGPGVYLVSADNRSIDPIALQAAYWEREHLPEGSRVFTDRDNALLAQTYGGVYPLTPAGSGIPEGTLSRLLLSPPSAQNIQTACNINLQYLISDQRLSTELPHIGTYIGSGEFQNKGKAAPPPVADLVQFDEVVGAERIYDNGSIRIYNLEGLPCQH